MTMTFASFVDELVLQEIEFPHLKVVQLAQAILESGRGSSSLFRDHRNPYGMKYRSEMSGVATSVSYTDHAGETDNYCKFSTYAKAVAGYWTFIDRSPYSGWRAASMTAEEYISFITYAGYLGGPHAQVPPERRAEDRQKKNAYIAKIRGLFAEARNLLAQSAKITADRSQIWRGRGVYLDVGHGRKPNGYDPGAVNGSITEHALNLVAAEACAQALRSRGIPVEVNDALATNLNAGRAAAGFDVMVSIHHNSTRGGPAQGSEAFAHASRGTAADRDLSGRIATAMAAELGIFNRGGKQANFDVLTGARSVGVRAASLAELYFIHRQSPANPPVAQFDDWSRRGGQAIAAAVLAWLAANR
jgi:N-acetylmuramoyl-L-alanine amidase